MTKECFLAHRKDLTRVKYLICADDLRRVARTKNADSRVLDRRKLDTLGMSVTLILLVVAKSGVRRTSS